MTEHDTTAPVWEESEAFGSNINLLTLLSLLLSRWPFYALMGVGGAIVGFGIALSLTPLYSSKAVFLPPPQRLSSIDNPLSMLFKPPTTAIYPGLLLSDSVLNEVIQRGGLQQELKAKDIEDARFKVRQFSKVTTDTSGFITLEVMNRDPKAAQKIASCFLDALAHLNNRLGINEAMQQRTLYQGELDREKNELENAEVELKRAQESSGVIMPSAQLEAGLLSIDRVRAQIRAQQVALAALLQGATEQSPGVVRARSQINALQSQLRSMEDGQGSAAGAGLTVAKAPSLSLKFIRLEREVKYHQLLLDIMSKQYENAKLQEISQAPAVQVEDFPEIPLRKSWPSRKLFAALGAVGGTLFGVIWVFAKNRMKVLRENSQAAGSLEQLRSSITRPNWRA